MQPGLRRVHPELECHVVAAIVDVGMDRHLIAPDDDPADAADVPGRLFGREHLAALGAGRDGPDPLELLHLLLRTGGLPIAGLITVLRRVGRRDGPRARVGLRRARLRVRSARMRAGRHQADQAHQRRRRGLELVHPHGFQHSFRKFGRPGRDDGTGGPPTGREHARGPRCHGDHHRRQCRRRRLPRQEDDQRPGRQRHPASRQTLGQSAPWLSTAAPRPCRPASRAARPPAGASSPRGRTGRPAPGSSRAAGSVPRRASARHHPGSPAAPRRARAATAPPPPESDAWGSPPSPSSPSARPPRGASWAASPPARPTTPCGPGRGRSPGRHPRHRDGP